MGKISNNLLQSNKVSSEFETKCEELRERISDLTDKLSAFPKNSDSASNDNCVDLAEFEKCKEERDSAVSLADELLTENESLFARLNDLEKKDSSFDELEMKYKDALYKIEKMENTYK